MSLVRNENLLHSDLTDKIIGTFYDVYNELGMDFWRKCTKMHWLMNYITEGSKLGSNMQLMFIIVM